MYIRLGDIGERSELGICFAATAATAPAIDVREVRDAKYSQVGHYKSSKRAASDACALQDIQTARQPGSLAVLQWCRCMTKYRAQNKRPNDQSDVQDKSKLAVNRPAGVNVKTGAPQ
jgi:hypothetical protein